MMLRELLRKILDGWNSANKEAFTNHPIAQLIRQDLRENILNIVSKDFPDFRVTASAGAGNWANVPWLSILNPRISLTTQDGIYPVYLFCADGSGVYLSLNQGTSLPKEKFGKLAAQKRALQTSTYVKSQIPSLNEWGISVITLNATTELGKSYELPNIAAKFYSSSNLPSEDELLKDLNDLMDIYKLVEPLWNQISKNDTPEEPPKIIKLKNIIPIPKPFILLAGISGTGKTRFVREQASAHRTDLSNYCLIPVRPDWHEPSDLLGYVSRIPAPSYVVTDLLRFLVATWKDAFSSASESTITIKAAADMTPHWLCLDEMNLAPVEQYFSDFLSVLETRNWDGAVYTCAPLVKAAAFGNLDEQPLKRLRGELRLSDIEYDGLWSYFTHVGIPIPPNLIVAGTVNMDETAHGFSRKVIDRAFTIDFGVFFPNDFAHYFAPVTRNKILGFPQLSNISNTDLDLVEADKDGTLSIAFLNAINLILKNTPFELAFRALNELLISLVCFQPKDVTELHAAWDDFLMTKVLPRIDGDSHKLQADGDHSLLTKLSAIGAQQLGAIWESGRPDLLRENADQSLLTVPCRSQQKLSWMQTRLSDNGFTSFWP